MYQIAYNIWIVVQIIIGYNLVLPLILGFLSLLVSKNKYQAAGNNYAEADYAIIVTAFEQTGMLPSVISSILHLNYSNFLIYVVADNCDISGLTFDDTRVVILRPPEILASNIKSHFYAINHFKRNHDRLTIIDSDNLVDPKYLTEFDTYFDAGFLAVQGKREPKNLNTTYARLDAARDIYYHYYDGQILFRIGSSATLAGSGMAFTVKLYLDCLEQVDISGAGFDKVLQAAILNRGHRIAYAPNAVVYDEKTSRPDQLVKQRARWINTWFKYFKFGFYLLAQGVLKFDRNRFVFGLVLLRPPLFLFLVMSVLCLFINVFISSLAVGIWLLGLLLFVSGFFIALLNTPTDPRIFRSLINIPQFIFYQLLSLLKVRKANSHSLTTQHYIDNPIEHSQDQS